ncbi:MAG: RecX family transcriptional regulator [Ignavibacteria bacterium]|nr:RecX family transcriptional regulator [Ignavibacteria bacterium]MBL0321046.1 RecX family transcriptional regulator [Ignavibacteria bacterium]
MGTITSIRRNVKDGGRCSVFVDEVFLAACPIDVATSLGLRKGLEMTDDLEHKLRKEDKRIVLRQKTYHFATYKPRTERQVHDYLVGREATPEEIDDVMAWLKEFKLLNDRVYAERFLDAARERKPLSRSMAKRTLARKGVPELIIDEVLHEQYSDDDAINAARRVASKKLRMITSVSDKERDEKLMRFLQYRGYPWNVIRTVLEELRVGTLCLAATIATLFVFAASQGTSQEITSCRRSRLPDAVNRFQPTTQPVLAPDGTLFLDRKLHPDNADGGVKDPDDVWLARRDASGIWLDAERTTFTSCKRPDIVFSFTSDGLAALAAGTYRKDGGVDVPSLAILKRRSSQDLFSEVEPVNIPGLSSLGRNFFAMMSDDRRTILLALERSDGMGGLDLYVSVRCGENWSAVINCGPMINTPAFEGAPWLAPDGETLYFASSGRDDRRGKSDIYVTRRIGSSWTSWSTPRNLGSCVNTIEDETAFSLIGRGDSALIHSWDAESGRPGIYVVELTGDVRPLPSCSFTGTVVDAVTNESLPMAELRIRDSASSCEPFEIPLDTATKKFTISLPALHRYHIDTKVQHYVPHHQVIGIRTLDSTTLLRVTTKVFDTRRPLASIYFDRGVAQLSDEHIAMLTALVQRYDMRQIAFDVVGYTDVVGTRALNTTLSGQRAESVAAQLVVLGLDQNKVRAIGRGIENPGTLLGLKENPQSRRVDIFPSEKSGR